MVSLREELSVSEGEEVEECVRIAQENKSYWFWFWGFSLGLVRCLVLEFGVWFLGLWVWLLVLVFSFGVCFRFWVWVCFWIRSCFCLLGGCLVVGHLRSAFVPFLTVGPLASFSLLFLSWERL